MLFVVLSPNPYILRLQSMTTIETSLPISTWIMIRIPFSGRISFTLALEISIIVYIVFI